MPHNSKDARHASQRAYYERHRDEIRAHRHAYYQMNREAVLQGNRASNQRNTKHVVNYQRAYYQSHRGHILQRKEAYQRVKRQDILAKKQAHYEATRDLALQAKRAYYQKHRDGLRDKMRQYRRAHPEMTRLFNQRRRTRRQGSLANLTLEEWKAIKALYKYRCAYCGKKETRREPLTQDHLIPVVKRGPYTMQNILPCCLSCNSHKGTGPPPRPVQIVLI